MVAAIFAVCTAPRWGTTATEVISFAVLFTAASHASRVNCSMQSPSVAPG